MSPPVFVTILLLGSASIALWLVHRYADHAPTSIWAVAAHLVAANLLSSAAPLLTLHTVAWLGPVAALMLVAFPAVVYFLVACAWLLLYLQRLLPARR